MRPFIFLIMSLGFSPFPICGQTEVLQLDQCVTLAREHYPQTRRLELIQQSAEYTLSNINKRYLPQVSVNGQATYQSAVTELPFAAPGITIEPLSKDQYRLYGEVNQPLTDMLLVKRQKELAASEANVQSQQLEVELYTLKERITQLYFGILLLDAQLEQSTVLKTELASSRARVVAAINNGVAIRDATTLIDIESVHADQRMLELGYTRRAYVQMLGLFIGQELPDDVALASPKTSSRNRTLQRPEMNLFSQQKTLLTQQGKLLTMQNIPHLGFFFQGGYGRPGLNMLNNQFTTFYITGFRLNWSLNGLYSLRKERKLLAISEQVIDAQQQTFEFNIRLNEARQQAEIDQIKAMLEKDDEIIALRETLSTTSKIQLENGTITSHDYITTLNALGQARLSRAAHAIQLQLAHQQIQLTTGN